MVAASKYTWLDVIKAGLIVCLGMPTLLVILERVFSFEVAAAVSAFTVAIICYPLFLYGSVNVFTRDKRQVTFLWFMTVISITLIFAIIAANYLLPLAPQL